MKRLSMMLLLVSAVIVSLSLLSTRGPSSPPTATTENAANVRKSCQRTRLGIQLLPTEQKDSKSQDTLSALLNSLTPSANAQFGCFPNLWNEVDCECYCMEEQRQTRDDCQFRGESGPTQYSSCNCQGTRAYDECMTRSFCYEQGERAMLRQDEPECFTLQ